MKESFVNAWRTFRLVNSNIPNFHSSVSVILNVLWIVHAIKAYEMSACKSYKESGMNEKKMHSAPPSSTMVERCTVIYRKLCLSQCYPLQNWCEWITMSRLIQSDLLPVFVLSSCMRSHAFQPQISKCPLDTIINADNKCPCFDYTDQRMWRGGGEHTTKMQNVCMHVIINNILD